MRPAGVMFAWWVQTSERAVDAQVSCYVFFRVMKSEAEMKE